MTELKKIIITGRNLTIDKLVAAAREPNIRVSVSEDCIDSMTKNRTFAEKVAARGDQVYGFSTGVGIRKSRAIAIDEMAQLNKRMIREHATSQGSPLPNDVTLHEPLYC